MAYSYNRLWKLMIDKKINKTTLRREAGITSNAMAKLGKRSASQCRSPREDLPSSELYGG